MANGVNGLLYKLPDFSNDVSFSSSDEDSYELYKNMQRIPDIPMPDFKKPLQSQKLFLRKSSSELRIRRSAILKHFESLGGSKQMIASTPKNPPSATADSAEHSLLQLSPIRGVSKDIDENDPVNTKFARDDLSVPGTNELLNHKKVHSHSYNNLSKKNQKKHVSASVRAVTAHLQNLSESLRKERNEQSKFEGRKNKTKKTDSNVKNAASASVEQKKPITEEQSRTSLKESLNKELHKNSENDLAGIEVLNFSSENDVVDSAITAVALCRHSRLPTRRTVLMERQTQTTDSLEKVFKKTSAVVSPLKEAEVEREGHSVKRKIIESGETSSREKKKSKTVLNPAEVGKQNNKKNQNIKSTEAQSSTSSLESEKRKQELQAIVFQRSMQNELPAVDADVELHNNMEDVMVENFLKSFDCRMTSAHIVSISSASENTSQKSLNNSYNMLDNIVSSEDTRISKDNLEDAHVADAYPNARDESLKSLRSNANHEQPSNSGIAVTANARRDLKNKSLENSKMNTSCGKYLRSRKNYSAMNTTLSNKSSETLQSSDIQGGQKSVASSMTLTNKIPEKPKPNSNLESVGDSSKIPAEPRTDNQRYTKDSETVDQVERTPRKRGRPKGSKSSSTMSLLAASNTCSNTRKRGRPKKTSVLPQSIEISKLHKKRGRPKGSKSKTVALQAYFVDRLSGFVRLQYDNPVQNDNEDNCRGENEPKRERKATKKYVQSHFVDFNNIMRKSLMPKPIKPAIRKSKAQVKHSNGPNPSTVDSTTHSVAKPSDFHSDESMKEPTLISKSLESIKDKSINTNKNKSVPKNKSNRKNVTQTTVNNTDLERIDSAIITSKSKNISVPEVSARKKRNTNINTQLVNNGHDPKCSNSVATSSTAKDISVSEVSATNKRNTSSTSQPVKDCIDPKSSNSISIRSTSKGRPVSEESARNKGNTNINTRSVKNGHDPNSSNSVTISSTAEQVSFRDTSKSSKKNEKNLIQTTENNNLDVENIEPDMVCPLPEAVSALKTSNKRNNKNRNISIKTGKNNCDLGNINSEIDTEVVCSLEVSVPASISPSTVRDNISTQINDNSFSATVSENQIVNRSESRSNTLYTIVNNEVTALNWFSQPADLDVEPPVSGMAIKYSLKNLKCVSGTSSCGHIIFAPKYQKPWQISKKHCIMYKVEKGSAIVKVNAKKKIVEVGSVFYIPSGAEYTIINLKAEPLILFFHINSPCF